MKFRGRKEPEPASRFWACFCAVFPLGLFWTQKMKKTQKWLIIALGIPLLSSWVSTEIISMISEISGERELYALLPLVGMSIGLSAHTILIYFMFRWTTQYNLEHFGYKSKREWKKRYIESDSLDG